jgi:hypothetical protein
MENKAIQELIAKYNEGLADPAEVQLLEQLIEADKVHLTQLTDLQSLHNQIVPLDNSQPSLSVDDRFYQMLNEEKQVAKAVLAIPLYQRLAIAAGLMVGGF